MIKTSDLTINPTCLGNTLLLVDILPAFEYCDGKKTEKLLGYKYTCAIPKLKMEKINILIEGNTPLIDITNGEEIPMKNVIFENLNVTFYLSQGNFINLKGTATNVSFAK